MKKINLVLILLFLTVGVFSQDKSIKVMSYNIRMNTANDGINAWPNRKENVKALVKFYETDILCVQEALPDQYDDLSELTDFDAIGVGRDDGFRKGEFAAIYYNKSRFLKRDGGTFWLSPTSSVPSKGWDAALNRICTWVKLFDRVTKKEFVIFNTHYDHIGVEARIQSAILIKQKINEIAPNLPVVLAGDLNVTPETEAISTIKSFLSDTREISIEPPYGPLGTFNGFKFESELKDRIDYVFVNKKFKVLSYAALSDSKDKRYYSDHLPVFAKLTFH